MPFTKEEIEEEREHFANVIATFEQKDIFTIPIEDRELLEEIGYKERILAADKAILANAAFLNKVVANPEIFGHDLSDLEEADTTNDNRPEGAHAHTERLPHGHSHDHSHSRHHGHSHHPSRGEGSHGQIHTESIQRNSAGIRKKSKYRPTEHDMEKLRSTLKQLVRDWSEEGKNERDACYEPMKEALLRHFSDIPEDERRNFRVLVPGAGLGRLAWDVAKLGFACQGNEFSHYMLLASFFMLNRTDEVHRHTIYPYVHSFSNMVNNEGSLRPIKIPDVLPSSLPPESDFSLVAGKPRHYLNNHVAVQAKNIVNYLRIIHRILAPGGVWINLGPLLWHWENNTTNDPSIELTLEEVKALARKIGFEISNERTIDTTYTNNARSMLGYVYHAEFWTAKKMI
ncbi:hypothetical protein BN946_scf184857.g25 [Trametes cinnabarina]|uniref:carnosine N-methyltransferase n=1 Tax=Pycnoporus cinnabarinus TaxID=5643 RepID=A0A060SY08_PYCCI|nr:hypothetical protein BN946_scf184857.g25 [Trametes cinnabarina]